MKVQVLTGSKREIAEAVVAIHGAVREAIVFVEEPSDASAVQPGEDIFGEMEPFTVKVGIADCSREAIYTTMPGE